MKRFDRPVPFSGKFLIGAAIGSGSMALAAERGGADFLLAINAGRLRSMGAPSIACMLPIFDATPLTEGFAREELLAQCRAPVLLGVNVWGRTFDPDSTARRVRDAGFAGVVNFPSAMHLSRSMQQVLSRAGRGIEAEVEQLRAAKDAGLVPMFYCATRTQARLAADAGIELICLNLGWNVGGALGHRRRTSLEEVATVAREIGRLIKRINPRCRFFLEGGPVATAEDLGRVLSLAPLDGYVGGSTFERMPLETSVADQIDRFRHASERTAALDEESERLVAWARPFGFVGRSEAQLDFLRRLKALSGLAAPILLLAESGQKSMPSLVALAGGARRNVVQIDVAGEDYPARARALLFGQQDSPALRTPLLADSEVGLLVIHAAERLPVPTQRRLARALRDGRFRAGESARVLPLQPRVAVVCDQGIGEDRLSEDLGSIGMDRQLATLLSAGSLRMPWLRERLDDLPLLIEDLFENGAGLRMTRSDFSVGALRALQAHSWPGNEAELTAVLNRLAARSRTAPLQEDEVLVELGGGAALADSETAARRSEPLASQRSERGRIVDALWRNGFNRTRTAEALGMSRKTLYNKIRRFGLDG